MELVPATELALPSPTPQFSWIACWLVASILVSHLTVIYLMVRCLMGNPLAWCPWSMLNMCRSSLRRGQSWRERAVETLNIWSPTKSKTPRTSAPTSPPSCPRRPPQTETTGVSQHSPSPSELIAEVHRSTPSSHRSPSTRRETWSRSPIWSSPMASLESYVVRRVGNFKDTWEKSDS